MGSGPHDLEHGFLSSLMTMDLDFRTGCNCHNRTQKLQIDGSCHKRTKSDLDATYNHFFVSVRLAARLGLEMLCTEFKLRMARRHVAEWLGCSSDMRENAIAIDSMVVWRVHGSFGYHHCANSCCNAPTSDESFSAAIVIKTCVGNMGVSVDVLWQNTISPLQDVDNRSYQRPLWLWSPRSLS